jgi:hypothetical protein
LFFGGRGGKEVKMKGQNVKIRGNPSTSCDMVKGGRRDGAVYFLIHTL